MVEQELIEKARLHVRRFFARNMPAWMTFHDLEHTLSVVRFTQEIGRGMKLPVRQLRALELAALFHDMGYARTYKGHEAESARLARAFLMDNRASAATITLVTGLIACTRMEARPRTAPQRVMRDADSAKAGQVDFEERSQQLRLELAQHRKKPVPPEDWLRENVAYLRAHRFHTPYARKRYGPQKALNLQALMARARDGASTVDGATQERFFDRDLSWLAFNGRVLQEAQDKRTPLLERLKFLAIHSNNLDEFYRVRVAQLRGLRNLKKSDRSVLEVPPEKRIARINAIALEQQRAFGRLYREELLPALAKEGIRFLGEVDLSAAQRAFVERFFTERIAPLLQTAALRPGNAPFIEDRKLYLVCDLLQKGTKKRKRIIVNVPSDELGRFIVLPVATKGKRNKPATDLLFLDDAIRLCAPRYFAGFKLKDCHAIKLSRDAELYLDEEFAGNVVEKVRRSLRKRRTGVPSRLLYDGAMPLPMLRELRALLGVKRGGLLRGGRYHNFSDMMGLPVHGRNDLREKPLPPFRHPAFLLATDPFAVIRAKDRLLQFPYHDFREVTDLLRKAARDPAVRSIAITLYRVARGSLVCEALLEAARAGKRVRVFVEVQARFDEGNNLFWGEALEQAGAQVEYGREGWKVHCKLCLIERREGARTVRYAYLGTGNFNERTATLYGDLGLLTANEAITRDVAAVLERVTDPKTEVPTRLLLAAPTTLRSGIEQLIDREIAHALRGKPAGILMKMNSLEDRPLIRKLYDASKAGVPVRLIVRGICCLVPGVEGLSKNISVVSIVDRFLEHARAYVFHNLGQPVVHLASADLMERNMDRRVETAFPLLDADVRREVLDLLELQWADQAKARVIDARQTNTYRFKGYASARALRSQSDQYERLKATKRPAKGRR